MSEAEQTAETKATETAPAATTVDAKAIRESKMFQQLAKEKAALEAKIEASAAAAKQAEEARLQQQGEFKTLADQRAAEIETIKAQHAREMLYRDADHALLAAGISHPALRKGYVADYLSDAERKPLSEWAEAIKADPLNAPLLSQVPAVPPVGAGPSAGAASRAGVGALDERLRSIDPVVRKSAQAEWTKKNIPGMH
jgi:hypothetical protein